MAKVHVDPAELKKFARELGRFNEELQGLTGALRGRMTQLSHTWNDQEQRKFEEEFSRTLKMLGRFADVSQQHIAFLMRKAQHLENYQQQR